MLLQSTIIIIIFYKHDIITYHYYITGRVLCVLAAVQNERDRINCRRPSYEEQPCANGLSVTSLLNAEIMSRNESDVSIAVESLSSCVAGVFFFLRTRIHDTCYNNIIVVAHYFRRPKTTTWRTSTWRTSATYANPWKLNCSSWSTGRNAYPRSPNSSSTTRYVVSYDDDDDCRVRCTYTFLDYEWNGEGIGVCFVRARHHVFS